MTGSITVFGAIWVIATLVCRIPRRREELKMRRRLRRVVAIALGTEQSDT